MRKTSVIAQLQKEYLLQVSQEKKFEKILADSQQAATNAARDLQECRATQRDILANLRDRL